MSLSQAEAGCSLRTEGLRGSVWQSDRAAAPSQPGSARLTRAARLAMGRRGQGHGRSGPRSGAGAGAQADFARA